MAQSQQIMPLPSNQILELLTWLGYNPKDLLKGLDGVRKQINLINSIT